MSQTIQPSNNDERDVFLQALERRTNAERAAFLDGACRGDARLRAAVDALLANADNSLLDQLADEARPTQVLPLTEPPGTVIGRYTLLQRIGEGGFGAVYMAEQKEPVRRRVALKIIKLGMDSQQVVARFEAERQALAMMDHPNIARVLDGGCTDTGRPYFVMELVKGQPVTTYCDEQKLSTRERLELFIPICQALQHAHQKGVIHRDIKPTNILVATIDGRPVPKMIDFGIAKAMQHDLTDKIVFTQFHQFMGTPAYMSPEQAAQDSTDIDTRSDIYSLGVLLYELLTGKTPVEAQELTRGGYDEIRRRIREIEPPTPSNRLSTLPNAELTTVARSRAIEPARLPKLIRGELDWIVLKALDKDRSRRYETANGLALDVRRYLDGEPVTAVKPTSIYRFQKFARRHKAGLAIAACFALLLAVSAGVSAAQAIRNKSLFTAAEEARLNEMNAKQREAELRRIAEKERAGAEAERDRSQRFLYTANMNLAKRAWDEAHLDRVHELLDTHRPQPGQPDLRHFEWFYLNRLCHSDVLTMKGHTDWVFRIDFSPDGKWLASAGNDRLLKVWNANTGKEMLTLRDHTNGVAAVAFSPDGKSLASGGWDKTIKLWDARDGQALRTLVGYTGMVASVQYSPDGKQLASGGGNGVIKVWNVSTGEEMLTLNGHSRAVWTLAFSRDGGRIASASHDHTVRLWDATNGREILTFKGHSNEVWGLAFSPDALRVASASNDGMLRVWDSANGQEMLSWKAHTGTIYGLAFSTDGKLLASASGDRTVKIWNATNGQEVDRLRGHPAGVMSVVFSPDGQRLASAGGYGDGAVKVWDATRHQETLTLRGHTSAVSGVAFSTDGKALASASSGLITVWDPATGLQTRTFKGGADQVVSVAFSPDGKWLATASGELWDDSSKPEDIKVWDVGIGQERLSLKGHGNSVLGLVFSPDGKRLASASRDQTVKLWDTLTGEELRTLKGHSNVVLGIAFSPDGKHIASASWDRTVKVWNADDGQELSTLNAHKGWVRSVTFSPDGTRLASASYDQTIKLWDWMTGQEVRAFKGHTAQVFSVAFSPDGKRLASASWDKTVRMWDTSTGQEMLTLRGHAGDVWSVAFSPDGNMLASASADETVKIWDATPRSGETTRAAETH